MQYHRERMSLYRGLVLTSMKGTIRPAEQYLHRCLEAASQVVAAYRALSNSDRLLLHWTCVNDILLSGFTVLYCSLHLSQSSQALASPNHPLDEDLFSSIQDTVNFCLAILQHIAKAWKSVQYHLALFQKLSNEVIQLTSSPQNVPDHQPDPNNYNSISSSDFDIAAIVPMDVQSTVLHDDTDSTSRALAQQLDTMTWDLSFGNLPFDNFMLSDVDLDGLFSMEA
jgi:hypothetical protein